MVRRALFLMTNKHRGSLASTCLIGGGVTPSSSSGNESFCTSVPDLSIHIVNNNVPLFSSDYVKRFSVRKKKEALSDFVRRIRGEKNLSLMKVNLRSGGQIAGSYVSRIENGYILNVTPKKLRALAKGLGVSEDEVFVMARGSDALDMDVELASLLQKYEALPKEHRDELRILIKVIDREIDRRLD